MRRPLPPQPHRRRVSRLVRRARLRRHGVWPVAVAEAAAGGARRRGVDVRAVCIVSDVVAARRREIARPLPQHRQRARHAQHRAGEKSSQLPRRVAPPAAAARAAATPIVRQQRRACRARAAAHHGAAAPGGRRAAGCDVSSVPVVVRPRGQVAPTAIARAPPDAPKSRMPPLAGDAAATCTLPPPRPMAPSAEPCACSGDDADAADRFLSHEALAREPHSLRALAPLLQVRRVVAARAFAGRDARC